MAKTTATPAVDPALFAQFQAFLSGQIPAAAAPTTVKPTVVKDNPHKGNKAEACKALATVPGFQVIDGGLNKGGNPYFKIYYKGTMVAVINC